MAERPGTQGGERRCMRVLAMPWSMANKRPGGMREPGVRLPGGSPATGQGSSKAARQGGPARE